MPQSELEPCPFCSSKTPLLIEHRSEVGNEYSVRCDEGCCEIGDEYREAAIAAWNTRATDHLPARDVTEALAACTGIRSGPCNEGMRIEIYFATGGEEANAFHILNTALTAALGQESE